MGDWKEILSRNEQPLSNDELLKYLDDNTSDEEKYQIEKKLADNLFESDAVDGLQKINSEKVKSNVTQLNKKLRQQLYQKNRGKKVRRLKDFQWTILTVLILLFICVASYFLIYLHNKNKLNQTIKKEYKR